MAVSGDNTSAYIFKFVNGKLKQSSTFAATSLCVEPKDAVGKVRSGETVYIASSKAADFHQLWNALV